MRSSFYRGFSAFVSLLPDHYGEVAKSRAVELPDSTRSACRTLRNQGDNPSRARCEFIVLQVLLLTYLKELKGRQRHRRTRTSNRAYRWQAGTAPHVARQARVFPLRSVLRRRHPLPLPPPSPPPPVTTTTLSDPRCSTHAGEGTDAWSTLWRQLWDESRQMLETSKDEL